MMTFCWSVSPSLTFKMQMFPRGQELKRIPAWNVETTWERGVVVKLISKMSSCIKPIATEILAIRMSLSLKILLYVLLPIQHLLCLNSLFIMIILSFQSILCKQFLSEPINMTNAQFITS